MTLRIGELLVRRGLLTSEQCEEILAVQKRTHRPFGVLAEELFDIPPRALQECWAEQYEQVASRADPRYERIDRDVADLISRRQAWQFRMLPMRYEGDELVLCTTRAHLPRALSFAYRHIGPCCRFVLSDPEPLGEALQKHYPFRGPISAGLMGGAGLAGAGLAGEALGGEGLGGEGLGLSPFPPAREAPLADPMGRGAVGGGN